MYDTVKGSDWLGKLIYHNWISLEKHGHLQLKTVFLNKG